MIKAFAICVLVPLFVLYMMTQLWLLVTDVNAMRHMLTVIVEHMTPEDEPQIIHQPDEARLTTPIVDGRTIDEGVLDWARYEVTAPIDDLLEPSRLTADELEVGLLGDLKLYSAYFVEAEANTGVNAIFLSAVAALESGWCTSRAALEYHNLFGWNIYGADMIGLDISSFDSKDECIAHVAQRLKAMYLTPGGVYFEGYSVDAVNTHYNGSVEWAESVKEIMHNIAARINNEL